MMHRENGVRGNRIATVLRSRRPAPRLRCDHDCRFRGFGPGPIVPIRCLVLVLCSRSSLGEQRHDLVTLANTATHYIIGVRCWFFRQPYKTVVGISAHCLPTSVTYKTPCARVRAYLTNANKLRQKAHGGAYVKNGINAR